jgi:general secretion pathway protein D
MRYRRIALNRCATLLTGCALWMALPLAASAAATPHAGLWAAATAAPAQFGLRSEDRKASDDLLRQARAAIKAGEFDKAEGLIGQAEKLDVKYDPLTARFVDTPDKLRKLLAEERAKRGPAAKPSSRIPSLLGGPQTATSPAIPGDPFQNTQGGAAASGAAADLLNGADKSRATALLADARKALAAGDKLAALAAWQKAAAIRVTYNRNEVSVDSVASELMQAGIDQARLVPASSIPASPYTLRPSDIDAASEQLPQLGGAPRGIPAAAAPGSISPYNLPAENNPLASGSPPGGAFQPIAGPDATAEPQRLPGGDPNSKAEAGRLVAQARVALDKGDVRTAQQLAEQAEALNVPDSAFGPEEIRPWQMALEVSRVAYRREGVAQVSGTEPGAPAVAGANEPRYPVAQGVYDPNNDPTRNVPATSQSVLSRPASISVQPGAGVQPNVGGGLGIADRLYREGMSALESQDREGALAKFTEAWKFQDQLDPVTRQQLKDKLTFLRASIAQPLAVQPGQPPSPLEQVNSQQEVLRQKLVREIANEEKAAEELAQRDPKGALANMQKLRERVSAADVEPAAKKQLLTLVDRRVSELTIFVEQNKSTIENDERNNEIKADLVRKQELTFEVQNKLAEMVERFNVLMDEGRYAEAEVVAKQANDLVPRDPVVVNMVDKSRLARNIASELEMKRRGEDAFIGAMHDIQDASIQNVGDENPLVFNAKRWEDLTKSKYRTLQERTRYSPAELEIQRSLSKPVEVRFENRPLAEVLDTLGRMTGVNVHLDEQGLHAEGVTTDMPVTISLTQPISLKSALNLILQPKGLSYVIQNEVLLITSEQTRDANTYAKVYYVADLVMPIPNFAPNYNLGLPGAIRESLNALGYGIAPRSTMAGPLTIAQNEQQHLQQNQISPLAAASNPEVLAQAGMSNLIPSAGGGRPSQMAAGPGGLGGGVIADFDSLIELITTTISPQSWDEVGGPGSISGFDTNLSLVVSQTQEVHEQLADLLEQLRRLQDLQVTIEVRFITLSDNFFERIGVDFEFDIDDNSNLNNFIDLLPTGPATDSPNFYDDSNPATVIGFSPAGPTADLDLSFTQGSFGTTPTFGGFDVNTAANFGFAILSDIEVFLLLQAAQGDNRTNILQAPKVTLFNGQQAFVSDTSQRPFVTSVVPVVGDFAAAQQPVIVVLNEGTSLNVQAVVSADRRFVRLTLVPFFSQIGDVDTFTFNGRVTTDSGTINQDPSNPDQNVTDNVTRTVEGTTVQLPTFAFTTVVTTVSVPDGGTVLLGGIKRLREGRNERGVPLLSKVPWVNRLFKNVGIGRDAQSLMMMVTPRIIIQEEEEEKLGIEVQE